VKERLSLRKKELDLRRVRNRFSFNFSNNIALYRIVGRLIYEKRDVDLCWLGSSCFVR